MVVVLVHRGIRFTLAAHECVGRGRARDILGSLRDDLVPLLTGTASFQQGRAEKKLRALASSLRGVVPPRRCVGAPAGRVPALPPLNPVSPFKERAH